MTYAAGAAHYHHLPLLRSTFKSLIDMLIHKMLLRDVWGYWFLTSHSGKRMDPDLQQLRQPWADPVVRENIMYSGHLLLMISLYTMLFNDDKYNVAGALTFNWNPIFWGMGPEKFSYTRQSLQAAILKEMELENWMGVCCEPNAIFVVCNQFPLIALRYNDVRDNTDISSDVLAKYQAAWKAKGMVQDNGLFFDSFNPNQGSKTAGYEVAFTSWALAFMNSWNHEAVSKISANLAPGFLAKPSLENHVVVPHPRVSLKIRELVSTQGIEAMDPATFAKASDMVSEDELLLVRSPFAKPNFACAMMWVSELGDRSLLDGMLSYADATLDPTWEEGGLFYPTQRSATPFDYRSPDIDAVTGNAGIAYGRLNVFDGQHKMIQLRFSGLGEGSYGLYQNNKLREVYDVRGRYTMVQVDLEISGDEMDVILKQKQ
ncbi:hypothetical protein LRP88_12536 [Fusarium phalaenopsidis]